MERRVTISLRLPEEVHAAIKHVADVEDRTVTAQILRFIRAGLQQYGAPDGIPVPPSQPGAATTEFMSPITMLPAGPLPPRVDVRPTSGGQAGADDKHQGQVEPPTPPSEPVVDLSTRPE
jgi:hypothetical protein